MKKMIYGLDKVLKLCYYIDVPDRGKQTVRYRLSRVKPLYVTYE